MFIGNTIPLCLATVSADLPIAPAHISGDMSALMQNLMIQVAIILLVSRAGGAMVHRLFKLPAVLGELAAGMLIGPYALGGMNLPGVGIIFPPHHGSLIPVSPELYGMATLASLLLLFLSGLETDLTTFLRYSVVGTAVGIGGVVFSFALGDLCAVMFGLADSFMNPTALFLGTVSTATSVGITARILTEKRKTNSPEGVTILAGAVLDDVLGIIVLAIVVAMTKVTGKQDSVHWKEILLLAAKTFGIWILCTVIGIVSARRMARWMKLLESKDMIASFALGLSLLLAGLLESAGLAMIIGAYIMGLSLSRTDLVHVIEHQLRGAYNLFVPVFFCVMGMLVDFHVMTRTVVMVGVVYSILAVIAKVAGCALPAWLMNFNFRGGLRIGAGMVPRGEVALIVAGIGLSTGAIRSETFGIAIMMTVLTTLVAPPMLVHAFEGKSGLRGGETGVGTEQKPISLTFPSPDIAELLRERIVQAFQSEEFFVYALGMDPPTYQIRKDEMVFTLLQDGNTLILTSNSPDDYIARLVVLEEILNLADMVESVKKMQEKGASRKLIADLFN